MAAGKTDSFSEYDRILSAASTESPWTTTQSGKALFEPDYDLMCRLMESPVRARAASESGRFARAIDAWIAQELRRAGFPEDAVWPRKTRPRVLSQDITDLLAKMPKSIAHDLRERIERMGETGSVDARFLGRAYEKQVDVAMARWDRGPELLISTKAQVDSFGKNLANRFEEAYGDAGNLRSRYPLAAVGFVFVQRSTILAEEPATFRKTVDMMRKLRDWGDGQGYTATGLLLVDWKEPLEHAVVSPIQGQVPQDLGIEQFMAAMVEAVLSVSPVEMHPDARARLAVVGNRQDLSPNLDYVYPETPITVTPAPEPTA